jgi:hypothetical protein
VSSSPNVIHSEMSPLDHALCYAAAGLSVVPVATDGTKCPARGQAWRQFQTRIPSVSETRHMFRGEVGIGIICGSVSGNLETLDVDAPELVEPFEAAVQDALPGVLELLPIVATPRSNGGGRHYRYRLEGRVQGNLKLAQSELCPPHGPNGMPIVDELPRNGRFTTETLIETRGEGGYAIAPGSPGTCHPSGQPYKQLSGPALTAIPVIDEKSHQTLLQIANSFNRLVDHDDANGGQIIGGVSGRPGDEFAASTTWDDVLTPLGWTKVRVVGGLTHWRRPGKSTGISATTGVRSRSGTELFCVFSSNAHPFNGPANGRACTSYNKFAAFAMLQHGGDFSAAAKELRERGFGAPCATLDAGGDAAEATAPRKTAATVLFEEVLQSGAELWHTPGKENFATISVDGHFEHMRIRSAVFRQWIAYLSYERTGKAPSASVLRDATTLLEGRAAFAGNEHESHVRVARREEKIYLDLCDRQWRSVEVSSAGWQVIENPPVRFRRAKAMLPLMEPVHGGSIKSLRGFVAASDDDWPLILGWFVNALRPTGPFPLAVLQGEQGSGKSTRARMIRELIDPNASPLRAEPRDARDLMIAANNGWIIAFDNLSSIPTWLSDALCRLSTGGGFSTRTLFENDEETIFDAVRPIIITGIDDVVTRGDLIDRSFLLPLPAISESSRVAESKLWTAFLEVKPQLLGALLDAVAAALRNEASVTLSTLPRMADAAIWATAAEEGLGLKPGEFMRAYTGNRSAANELALEASPVSRYVRELAENGTWAGRASELLVELERRAPENVRRLKSWPTAGNVLSGRLKRLAPNLRATGVNVTIERGRRGSHIRIEKVSEIIVTSVTKVTSLENAGISPEPRDVGDDLNGSPPTGSSREAGELPEENDLRDVSDDGDDVCQACSQPIEDAPKIDFATETSHCESCSATQAHVATASSELP